MLVSFNRVLKFAAQDFFRNFWLSLVTITVLTLALFSVNILIGLNALSQAVITTVEQKVDITIGIAKTATKAEADNFQVFVKNLKGVDSVTFTSKEDMLAEFKKKNADNPAIQASLQELQENPLNDTIVIKAKDTADYRDIIFSIQHSDFQTLIANNNFSSPEKVIAFVESVTTKVEKFGWLLTIIFASIALLIVFNTIRVTIYTHRDEIAVMRLVGATNSFIRMPYIIEGAAYALISVGLMVVLVFSVLEVIQPYMGTLFADYGVDLQAYFSQQGIMIFGLELLGTLAMTVISSWFAVRKYLRV